MRCTYFVEGKNFRLFFLVFMKHAGKKRDDALHIDRRTFLKSYQRVPIFKIKVYQSFNLTVKYVESTQTGIF